MTVPFNKSVVLGTELDCVKQVIDSGSLSGNGVFSKAAAQLLEEKTTCKRAVLTSSCTDALEMCALLCDLKPGDEVIMPSYTFVSTASAFALRGVNIVWCDIRRDTKNIDETCIEPLITAKTKAVVVVHYGGVGCEMDAIIALCKKHNVVLVEDAAQAIDCFYKGKPLGSFGDLATLSFHDTKNIQCGEGGALLVNNDALVERAEILRDKGTDRTRFLKGLVDKYTWVELGSSFLMSELQGAFLKCQLEQSQKVNRRRVDIWNRYYQNLSGVLDKKSLPHVPSHCAHNGHVFYVLNDSLERREAMTAFLKENGVIAAFHYVPLHLAPYWQGKYSTVQLPVTVATSECLLRLPMFYDLTDDQVDRVCALISTFVNNKKRGRT